MKVLTSQEVVRGSEARCEGMSEQLTRVTSKRCPTAPRFRRRSENSRPQQARLGRSRPSLWLEVAHRPAQGGPRGRGREGLRPQSSAPSILQVSGSSGRDPPTPHPPPPLFPGDSWAGSPSEGGSYGLNACGPSSSYVEALPLTQCDGIWKWAFKRK